MTESADDRVMICDRQFMDIIRGFINEGPRYSFLWTGARYELQDAWGKLWTMRRPETI